ncbi:AgmX/PglI C-terminal domain-containing protein [Pyxidicoccus trucidator]|uniref:AgmX/PglI C-terminal domain-containing protein n=1 Tax=Pyxidicoccus trucidator TaxID=2709662 RepID=UPI001F0848AC|nr:AgmX/PglI C-terminal domain-containing protein [Pyxidicoccus trucidator]
MGELLSGAEGQFRGQGMGTPGTTSPAGGAHGPVPGVPLSVEDALDGDLDAYLDRELFVHQGAGVEASEASPATTASGSMRALLDLAEQESQWLKTLPPPSVDVLPEPEEPAVEIPEWMRMSPGVKVTTRFSEMLAPVDPASVQGHAEAAHGGVGTDAAGLPMTPWSVPVSAQQASATPAYPGNLLPGIAPPPPGVPLPSWGHPHAAPMAQYPQQWGMPLPTHVEPKRVGMKPGAFLGAAAVGALAAGMLVVAGLHFREHLTGTGTTQGVSSMAGTAQAGSTGAVVGTVQVGNSGTLPPGMAGAAQLGSTSAVAGTAQVGSTGALPSGLAGVAQAGSTGMNGEAQVGTGALLPSGGVGVAQLGGAGTGVPSGVNGEAQAGGIAGPAGIPGAAQAGQPLVTGAQGQPQPGAPGAGTSAAQQAAASVSGTVLSTAQGDVQGAANGLRAQQPTTGPMSGSAVGGTTLTSGQPATVALRMPSARKVAAKTVVASRPADTEEEAEDQDSSEHNFNESESSAADEESITAEAAEAEEAEEQQSELDEDFARELGFTEDAEQKAAKPAVPERTVYIPPAPDAKEHLTPEDVKAVVVTNQPAITACIRQHAKGTPVEGGGRFLVRWSVLPSGDTSSVSMDTDTLKATSLAHCIEDVVRRWKFPAHQVRMAEPIRFPFVF